MVASTILEPESRLPVRRTTAYSTPATRLTNQGHKYLYTCAPDNIDHAEEFSIVPFDSPDQFTFTGYFKLASIRTNLRATYGSDTTPAGRPRVYQEPDDGSTLYLY